MLWAARQAWTALVPVVGSAGGDSPAPLRADKLERIALRTGCDLRRLADVMELLIAVRLLGAA